MPLQSDPGIEGENALAAGAAMVVVAAEADPTQKAEEASRAVAVAARVLAAVGTDYAGALVAPFFRSSRAVCKSWAPSW
jgi:hypothetical protein